ncbi:NYN domain-containing protein [Candidatus Pacearchaeota archaeon]|nr:NYN domain-containing protein [Candidatus Pacearchaeota archaeon]
MERISIYIDGANFYHSMRTLNKKYSDFYFDFKKYIKKITKNNKLIDVYYFNAPLKQQYNAKTYTKQQLQINRLKKAGYNVILCKRKKIIDKDGNESHKIKEDDIRLALQMQKDAYNNKYDIAYLFSGDGDFAPLPEYLKEKSKKVKVFYFDKTGSFSLLKSCGFNCEIITKKIVNKYYCRGAYYEWERIKEEREKSKELK